MFVITCWKLWKRRCCILLQDDYVERDDFLPQCIQFKDEIAATEILKTGSRGSNLGIHCWKKPDQNWVKVNADGAMRGTMGMVATGEVVRDDHGNWIRGFSRSIGFCIALNAELWVLHDTLLIAWDMEFRKVETETDCRTIVELLNNSPRERDDSATVTMIQALLLRDWEAKVKYTHREANMVADKRRNG
ncbi:hypothetical protein F3Y22_tig00113124pilonHSYRG00003 [Hibiscus syriacus]|uniref:RNase H type-1 domain-containing protein n=1 Tax=Hibiscus syriacus TaxID=106335 RepID=A0A6A2WPQ3_HIBSY|nr:hypothetical protein F3Y22_tig00113124pilonHSYRG00003 [Hibiscus syriacus]